MSILCLSSQLVFSQKTPIQPTMKADMEFLASDALEGRGTGSEGERKAALFIIDRFNELGLQAKGDSGWFQKFTYVPHGGMQKHQVGDSTKMGMQLVKEIVGHNVIGYLDFGKENTIIIGAHYDHLGYGDENSLWTGGRAIHNGADDNASGVTVMLELARYLSQDPKSPRENNYLFIGFSGEEKGLWGSNYFTKNPTIDLKKADYMINMDMVGRLNAEKTISINGVGTSPIWKKTLKKIKVDGIKIVTTESGVGPSDHTSFYLTDIPAIHFFTGQHEDYHKPTDDADKINYAGMESVTRYIEELLNRLNGKGNIAFTKTVDDQKQAADFKVTLGVIPDYLYSGKGMRIDGAKEGRPGFKAGLKKGDIILQLGDTKIDDIYAYMGALGKYGKGDSTRIVIEREGKEMTLQVTFE
jgi:hypothetical protein